MCKLVDRHFTCSQVMSNSRVSGSATRGARASSGPNAGRVPSPDRRVSGQRAKRNTQWASGSAPGAGRAGRLRRRCAGIVRKRGGRNPRAAPRPRYRAREERARSQRESAARRSARLDCGLPAGLEPLRELAPAHQGQQFLRGPQRHGRSPGARAFQADFTQVQFRRGEVGVGGIMFVQRPHTRIAKQHATAPVGLQAVLVGINHNRVGLADLVERGAGFLPPDFRRG